MEGEGTFRQPEPGVPSSAVAQQLLAWSKFRDEVREKWKGVKRRVASKPIAAEQVARDGEQREHAQAGPSEDAVGEAEKTKEGVMGVAGNGYILPRKKRVVFQVWF